MKLFWSVLKGDSSSFLEHGVAAQTQQRPLQSISLKVTTISFFFSAYYGALLLIVILSSLPLHSFLGERQTFGGRLEKASIDTNIHSLEVFKYSLNVFTSHLLRFHV